MLCYLQVLELIQWYSFEWESSFDIWFFFLTLCDTNMKRNIIVWYGYGKMNSELFLKLKSFYKTNAKLIGLVRRLTFSAFKWYLTCLVLCSTIWWCNIGPTRGNVVISLHCQNNYRILSVCVNLHNFRLKMYLKLTWKLCAKTQTTQKLS